MSSEPGRQNTDRDFGALGASTVAARLGISRQAVFARERIAIRRLWRCSVQPWWPDAMAEWQRGIAADLAAQGAALRGQG